MLDATLKTFIRTYAGYCFAYLSYKISLYTWNKLFEMVAEIIEIDNNTKDIVTTHDYETGKEIVNMRSVRGGPTGPLERSPVGKTKQSLNHTKIFLL